MSIISQKYLVTLHTDYTLVTTDQTSYWGRADSF
jgi:hypothetical protein